MKPIGKQCAMVSVSDLSSTDVFSLASLIKVFERSPTVDLNDLVRNSFLQSTTKG
jgi:hypothetical protein